MCGRFTLTSTPESLAERFELEELPEFAPRYNIAPGQRIQVVRAALSEAGKVHRSAAALRWGLVPSWSKDAKHGARMINARAETAASKPAFRTAMRRRRCLVPATGFYEWAKRGEARQPYWIGRSDRALFAFAGLWERWSAPDGEVLETCSVLTTEANEKIAALHHRMPVILEADAEARWLDPGIEDPGEFEDLLRPLPSDALDFHPVSTRVNRVGNDDAACLDPVPEPPGQSALF